jgi:hypothetical protein
MDRNLQKLDGQLQTEITSKMPGPHGSTVTAGERSSKTQTVSDTDPFNPARFRLSQDFQEELGVKKALLTVPVGKHDRQTFFRVRAEESYLLNTAVLELKEERETYLVDPSLALDLQTEIVRKTLYTAITRQGVLFLLPVRLPAADGRLDEWNRSLMQAAEIATRKWVRVSANMSLGANDVFEATGNIPEPEWPDVTFSEILRIAFKDRLIETVDHPVLRKLRGEI